MESAVGDSLSPDTQGWPSAKARYTRSILSPLAPPFVPKGLMVGGRKSVLSAAAPAPAIPADAPPNPDVDPMMIEALTGPNRWYVLRVAVLIQNIIAKHQPYVEVVPPTPYDRMITYRCAAYYRATVVLASKKLIIYRTLESRIPPRLIKDLVPEEPEDSQISDTANGNEDDIDARSDSGVVTHIQRRRTAPERAAAYHQARARIVMDFETTVAGTNDPRANYPDPSIVRQTAREWSRSPGPLFTVSKGAGMQGPRTHAMPRGRSQDRANLRTAASVATRMRRDTSPASEGTSRSAYSAVKSIKSQSSQKSRSNFSMLAPGTPMLR